MSTSIVSDILQPIRYQAAQKFIYCYMCFGTFYGLQRDQSITRNKMCIIVW